MTTKAACQAKSIRLPRRDWIFLPAIFVLTWVCLGTACETLARLYLPEQKVDACEMLDSNGGRFQARCHARTKLAEGAWVNFDYNDCGYRSALSCQAPAASVLRVAVLGTSVARGYWVSYEQSFAGRIEHALSAVCARPVDLQTVSQAGTLALVDNRARAVWDHVADRVPEALALQPKALLLVMSPFDLENYTSADRPSPMGDATSTIRSFIQKLRSKMFEIGKDWANESRFILLARHLGYADTDRSIVNYLRNGDPADSLRPPFTPNWELRLGIADATIGRIAAAAAGTPLIVVFMPQRAQAMLSADSVADKHGADPFALGRALAAIVQAHHARFIDMTRVMQLRRDVPDLFFPVDGHPNAAGHAVVADTIAQALVRDLPDFTASCHVADATSR